MKEYNEKGYFINPSLDEQITEAVFKVFREREVTIKEAEEALDRLIVNLETKIKNQLLL